MFGITDATVAEPKNEKIAHHTYFKAIRSDFDHSYTLSKKNIPGYIFNSHCLKTLAIEGGKQNLMLYNIRSSKARRAL